MKALKKIIGSLALTLGLTFGGSANAGIPTIDVATLGQGILQVKAWGQQYQQMVQQYQQMVQQFDQMRQQYSSLNGIRGMASLVNDPALRQYLPADYQTILNSGYGSSAQIRAAMKVFGVSDSTMAADSDSAKAFTASANQAALNRATAEDGYKKASNRFADIQVLLDKVDSAPDAKDIADLQGRIQAEQVMMQNENTKLAMLGQLAQAQKDLLHQQSREISMKSGKGGLPTGW